jgi:predicted  nucleic acid-binding Zn-ribbon protein
MIAVGKSGWLIAAFGALALAGCVSTGGSLTSAAERLERSTDALHDEARDERGSSDYSRDAQELAAEARDFRQTLEDRRADDDDIQDAFRDLSRRYHAVRDDIERSDSRDAELDFKPVTEAYLDVERGMSRYGEDRDRVARDD